MPKDSELPSAPLTQAERDAAQLAEAVARFNARKTSAPPPAPKRWTTVQVNHACPDCGTVFQTPALKWEHKPQPEPVGHVVCQPCFQAIGERAAAETKARIIHQRTRAFDEICPPVFRDTNADRLPCGRPTVSAVAKWAATCPTFGTSNAPNDVSPQLLLHGPTGTGKTRLALLALKHLVSQRGCPARLSMPGEFARDVADAYRNGEEKRLHHQFAHVEVLMLDDLGKERLTERVEAFLFELLDHRLSWRRTTILTTNHVGADLAAKFTDPERGAALVRRLKEFCHALPVVAHDGGAS